MGRLVASARLQDQRASDRDETDGADGDARSAEGPRHAATLRHAGTTGGRGYTGAVPDEATDNGFPSTEEVDVDALFAALKEEIRRSGADPGAAGEPDDRRAARAEAERLWPVSADRPLRLRPGFRGGLGTPVKAVLRKLMRWYVEPLAYDQRSFNAAALRLVDDLEQRVATLEAELARHRAADPR
jgi:uncharacterized small protein (DUF1192 family)